MTWRLPVLALLVGLSSTVACGSDDDESGPCDALCNCLVSEYDADKSACMTDCNSQVDQGGGKDECVSQLNSRGYSECLPTCDSF